METENLKPQTKAFTVKPELKVKIDNLIKDLKAKEIAKTDEEVIAILLDNYLNPTQNTNTDQEENLQKTIAQQNQQLDTANKQLAAIANLLKTSPDNIINVIYDFQNQINSVNKQAKDVELENQRMNAEYLDTKKQNHALKEQLLAAKQAVEQAQAAPAVPENAIVVKITDAEQKLIQETIKRLSERHNQTITADDMLRKMFLRYTIEHNTEWFYRFVLKDAEIEQITGISIKQWKEFFN